MDSIRRSQGANIASAYNDEAAIDTEPSLWRTDDCKHGIRVLAYTHVSEQYSLRIELDNLNSNLRLCVDGTTNVETISDEVLAGYDVFYAASGHRSLPSDQAAVIERFLESGGGVVIGDTGRHGPISWLPTGFEAAVTTLWLPDPNGFMLTGEGMVHPIFECSPSTDRGLRPNIQIYTTSLGPEWQVLAKHNGDSELLGFAVGTFGKGRIILWPKSLAAFGSSGPPSFNLITNAFDWVAPSRSLDCNENGRFDSCDIADGTSMDCDEDGFPDECLTWGDNSDEGDGSILYVDGKANPGCNGRTWTQALASLNEALQIAALPDSPVKQIWVAAGTYFPSVRTIEDDPRSATFQLVSGIALLGGFNGTETDAAQRDSDTNITILSGDLAGNDRPRFINREENAKHVVTGNGVDASAKIDGFTITAGYFEFPLNESTSRNLSLGAGMYVDSGSPIIRNCTFTDNFVGFPPYPAAQSTTGVVATGYYPFELGGAGLFAFNPRAAGAGSPPNDLTGPTLIGCKFIGNASTEIGAGAYFFHITAHVIDCLFEENDGGALAIIQSPQANVMDSRFLRNFTYYGGGSAIHGDDVLFAEVTRCELTANDSLYSSAVSIRLAQGGVGSITDCLFKDNRGWGYGGGASLFGQWTVSKSIFDYNTAQIGGALFLNRHVATICACTFVQNYSEAGGGAIAASSGHTLIQDCKFTSNGTSTDGGAVCIVGGDPANETLISDSRFERNRARYIGGAVFSEGSDLKLVDSVFRRNSAEIGGGAAYPKYVNRCVFQRNSATLGGGIAYSGGTISHSLLSRNFARFGGAIANGAGALTIESCTLANNRAQSIGGAVLAGSGLDMTNSIVWNNVVGPFGSSRNDQETQLGGVYDPQINYSIVEGWTGTYGGLGNSGVDPGFVETLEVDVLVNVEDEDFRLLPDSPAINSGDPSYVWPERGADLDGHARVLCGRVDRGAYEFGIGDANCDGTVERDELILAFACLSGPESLAMTECAAFDFHGDGAIDLRDVALLQVHQTNSP